VTETRPIQISDVAGADDRRKLEERRNAFTVESTGYRDARERSCVLRDDQEVLRRQRQARPEVDAAPGQQPMGRPLDPSKLGDHLDRLYRAAWALTGSREDAEDLVQETYARVLARPRLLRNEDDLFYLLRALRNTFLTQKRTESRRLRPNSLPDQLDIVADPRARQPQAALEASELYAAVAELPDDYRDVLVAVDITGLSYKEAARALRIPTGTVMSRLYRARQQVVRRIEGGSA
jgi:RNA polymerase sigma-70 factor, ECF subfamily